MFEQVIFKVYHTNYLMGREILPCGQSSWAMKMTTHLHAVPRVRMNAIIRTLPVCLHCIQRAPLHSTSHIF